MRLDRRGDLGFGEAIIATMAVVILFNAFSVVVISTSADDPGIKGFDTGVLGGEVSDGVFTPSFQPYMEEYLATSGATGMSVSVTFPGGYCGDATVGCGSMEGTLSTTRVSDTIEDDRGQRIPVVYGVTVCV